MDVRYANLHLHSTYSDAGFTPHQLVLIGKSLGYKALALTDHETDGGNRVFAAECAREGLDCVTGAEFYGKIGDYKVHLTALDFDPDAPSIRSFIKKRCDLQAEKTRKTVEFGIKLGILDGLTWQDVLDRTPEGSWLCIDSVLNAVREMRVELPEGLDAIRPKVFKAPEVKAFNFPHPEAEEVIAAVRKAGGIIALAHPNAKFTEHIEKLVDLGLNGIETGHPNIAPEVLPLAIEAAEKYNLYHCGGTDHDGPMSCCGGERAWPTFDGVTEEQYFALKNRTRG
ncbi:MAG: hypothetical protein E7580_07970 [Ruminococcaceae bacterium]|nr:hypothetical protein [Oscillospiraceae bacterium]